MAWVYVVLAGILEMVGVVMIGKWNRDRSFAALAMLIIGFGVSFLFLSLAMKDLPMGTAYAVWTGIGASGGAIMGMLLFGESKDGWRIFFIAMILAAAVGLKLFS
ncbi:Multidrug resistance protein YkkD [compost metagenome]